MVITHRESVGHMRESLKKIIYPLEEDKRYSTLPEPSALVKFLFSQTTLTIPLHKEQDSTLFQLHKLYQNQEASKMFEANKTCFLFRDFKDNYHKMRGRCFVQEA